MNIILCIFILFKGKYELIEVRKENGTNRLTLSDISKTKSNSGIADRHCI